MHLHWELGALGGSGHKGTTLMDHTDMTKKSPHCWFQKHLGKRSKRHVILGNNTHDLTHEKLEKICTILPVINLIRSGVSGTSSNILITRPCYAYETLSSFELPVWKQFIAVTLRKLFWLPNYWRDVRGVQSQCWVSKGEGHTYNRTDGS